MDALLDRRRSLVRAPGGLGYRLRPAPAGLGWVPVALVVLGLLFTWWARLHLGVMWSGGIDRKEHHRIVDTGPYRPTVSCATRSIPA